MIGEIWTLKLKATSELSTLNSEKTAEYGFSINILDGCLFDELSTSSTIEDFYYYIAETGLLEISAPGFI